MIILKAVGWAVALFLFATGVGFFANSLQPTWGIRFWILAPPRVLLVLSGFRSKAAMVFLALAMLVILVCRDEAFTAERWREAMNCDALDAVQCEQSEMPASGVGWFGIS